ncbi:hypothetical protein CK203_066669 [Vitis vinifera]|uniref:DUF4283 domain-containing protein n=1 Tax=Vitis vinifera TaxID=29760 RepID=A0A438EV62_VITVI|nr:hypothetical protein CK203_066669 [Vitis vinifera]
MSATAGGLVIVPVLVLQFQIWLTKRRKNGERVSWAQQWESVIGPTKPDAFFKARSVRAQFGAKSFRPPAGPVHETEAGFSNGGPIAPLSSKLQCSGFSAKKGNIDCSLSRVVKVKRPLSLSKAQTEANLAIFRGNLVSNKGVLSPVPKTSQDFTGETGRRRDFVLQFSKQVNFASQCVPFSNSHGVELSRRVGVPFSEGNDSSPKPEPPTLLLKGFQIEGLMPRKMVKETKREIWDKRFVSSVWKGRSMEWAALPASVKLNSSEEGSFWLTSVYGPNKPLWRKDFWLELQDLYSLTFPLWESGFLDPPLRNADFTWSNMQVVPICKRMTNGRRSRKFIKSLISEMGVTLSNIEVIFEEIVNFFGKLYSKPEGASWRVEGVDWVPIPGESAV